MFFFCGRRNWCAVVDLHVFRGQGGTTHRGFHTTLIATSRRCEMDVKMRIYFGVGGLYFEIC